MTKFETISLCHFFASYYSRINTLLRIRTRTDGEIIKRRARLRAMCSICVDFFFFFETIRGDEANYLRTYPTYNNKMRKYVMAIINKKKERFCCHSTRIRGIRKLLRV